MKILNFKEIDEEYRKVCLSSSYPNTWKKEISDFTNSHILSLFVFTYIIDGLINNAICQYAINPDPDGVSISLDDRDNTPLFGITLVPINVGKSLYKFIAWTNPDTIKGIHISFNNIISDKHNIGAYQDIFRLIVQKIQSELSSVLNNDSYQCSVANIYNECDIMYIPLSKIDDMYDICVGDNIITVMDLRSKQIIYKLPQEVYLMRLKSQLTLGKILNSTNPFIQS